MNEQPVPLFLAPMAGVTDLAYRLLARECGADLSITEFTAASGLSRHDASSWLKVESDPREKPFIPQIFGGDISEMVTTVKLLEHKADIIDINFGCPAPKVCRNNAGAALLRSPDQVIGMVRSCINPTYFGSGTTKIYVNNICFMFQQFYRRYHFANISSKYLRNKWFFTRV
jgi:tRNA-dihydrouridine synthase